jgi:hypothetical protein
MKVLIIPDMPGWSCDFTSEYIISHLPDIEFEKRYVGGTEPGQLFKKDDDFDTVWLMLHYLLERIISEFVVKKLHENCKFLLGIRGPYGLDVANSMNLEFVDAIGVQSIWAYNALRATIPEYSNIWVTRDGVDEQFFVPDYDSRPSEFVVGWAGQPRLAVKRFDVVQQVCSGFKHKYAAAHAPTGDIPYSHKEMPNFYNSLSAFVHLSEREGAPRPVIEAASCGLPVVMTKTGYGQEIIDKYWQVDHPHDAAIKLKELQDNPELCHEVGERNRQEILNKWTWKDRAGGYDKFFRQEGQPIQQ